MQILVKVNKNIPVASMLLEVGQNLSVLSI